MAQVWTSKAKGFFANIERPGIFDEFFEPHVKYQDPFVTLRGLRAVERYYLLFFKRITQMRLEYVTELEGESECALFWRMHFKWKRLSLGKSVICEGTSHFRFNASSGKAYSQRDYLDLGQLLVENLPLVGKPLEKVKNEVANFLVGMRVRD